MDNATAAPRRPRRSGTPVNSQAGVADPSRGTLVAIGLPAAALLAALGIVPSHGAPSDLSIALVLVLLVAPAVAERVAIQVGPRSWYTASTPAIVLAGVVGGPFVGLCAGITSQSARVDVVWRRRLAEGGIASLQGLGAGTVGLAGWSAPGEATLLVVGAVAGAIVVNTAGRALIILERGSRPFLQVWGRGIAIDGIEAVVAAPLLAVLVVVSRESPLLVALAISSIVVTLTIAQRIRRNEARTLEAEQANARRDQLTGAPNRRAFEEALVAEHARIVRGGQPCGLFVADIDRFKSINDRYGHAVGDEVIVAVVDRLRDGLRPSDTVARWGGEELTILAPGIRTRQALEEFAERVRTLVSDVPLVTTTTAHAVTVSVGGTLLDGSAPPIVAMRRADAALYEAKRTRNASSVSLPQRLSLRLESA